MIESKITQFFHRSTKLIEDLRVIALQGDVFILQSLKLIPRVFEINQKLLIPVQ